MATPILTTRSNEEIAYLRAIKQVFDPNNIINPGKIFDLIHEATRPGDADRYAPIKKQNDHQLGD